MTTEALTPRPYQLEAIDRAVRSSYLLADECGLGKTLTAIEAIKALTAQHNKPALVVIPKPLKAQWVKALTRQGVEAARIALLDAKGATLASEPEKKPDPTWLSFVATLKPVSAYNKPPVILAHYEAVVKHLPELSKLTYCLIVADEAHKIKNRKAKRTEALKKLSSLRRLALTGTPFDRNPADVWSILNWLDPRFFTSYWRFFDAHVAYKEVPIKPRRTASGQIVSSVKTPVGVADHERFARVLRQYSLRRLKTDVRADLPEKITQYVDVALNDDQAKLYKKLSEAEDLEVMLDEATDLSVVMPILLTKILRLIQCTTDPALLEAKASSAKLEWLQEWLEANPDQPVIVFTRFRETALKIAEQIKANEDINADPVVIIGSSKRPEITGNERIIVGTIAAMGEGLDLPHINTAIFVDCEWSSILMTQAIDRIHRINITATKHIIYLKAPNTVDELLLDAVEGKWSTMQLVQSFIRGENIANEGR